MRPLIVVPLTTGAVVLAGGAGAIPRSRPTSRAWSRCRWWPSRRPGSCRRVRAGQRVRGRRRPRCPSTRRPPSRSGATGARSSWASPPGPVGGGELAPAVVVPVIGRRGVRRRRPRDGGRVGHVEAVRVLSRLAAPQLAGAVGYAFAFQKPPLAPGCSRWPPAPLFGPTSARAGICRRSAGSPAASRSPTPAPAARRSSPPRPWPRAWTDPDARRPGRSPASPAGRTAAARVQAERLRGAVLGERVDGAELVPRRRGLGGRPDCGVAERRRPRRRRG